MVGCALLVTALRLVVTSRAKSLAFNLLLTAFGLQLLMDTVAAVWRGYTAGSRFEVLWALAYVASGAALVDVGDTAIELPPPSRQADLQAGRQAGCPAGCPAG